MSGRVLISTAIKAIGQQRWQTFGNRAKRSLKLSRIDGVKVLSTTHRGNGLHGCLVGLITKRDRKDFHALSNNEGDRIHGTCACVVIAIGHHNHHARCGCNRRSAV